MTRSITYYIEWMDTFHRGRGGSFLRAIQSLLARLSADHSPISEGAGSNGLANGKNVFWFESLWLRRGLSNVVEVLFLQMLALFLQRS